MNRNRHFFIAGAVVILLSLCLCSCYYDNEEALYPSLNNSCDTANVTFSGKIILLLNNNCYSCHSDANASFGGNVHLQKYSDVVSNASRIDVAIKQTGSVPMPPNGKLSTCSITEFDIWIRNGMQNN